MKNICFTDNELFSLLNFRGDIIKYFLETGNKITIIIPEDRSIDIKKFDNRINMYYANFSRKSKNPFSNFSYFNKLRKIYKKEKFDIRFVIEKYKDLAINNL